MAWYENDAIKTAYDLAYQVEMMQATIPRRCLWRLRILLPQVACHKDEQRMRFP